MNSEQSITFARYFFAFNDWSVAGPRIDEVNSPESQREVFDTTLYYLNAFSSIKRIISRNYLYLCNGNHESKDENYGSRSI